MTSAPSWIAENSEKVLAARGHPARLMALFTRSSIPMLMLDDQRRYVEVNRAARKALGRSLEELRELRLEDMTPPQLWPRLESNWNRMLETGTLFSHEVTPETGNFLGITYYGIADVLPERHVLAFVPAGWPATEPGAGPRDHGPRLESPLTPRELEVLELAADGLTGPGIAKELLLSTATVRTHFGHIYRKLDVPDRAAAVATAMRLGLIH